MEIVADKLKVDLVQHVGHQNERGDDALAAAALHLALDLSVPDVVVVGDQRAAPLGHLHDQVVLVVDLRIAAVQPVVLGGVAQELRVDDHIVLADVEVVFLVDADRRRRAGFHGVRGQRVAAAQAEVAGAAAAVFWRGLSDRTGQDGAESSLTAAARLVLGALVAIAARGSVFPASQRGAGERGQKNGHGAHDGLCSMYKRGNGI